MAGSACEITDPGDINRLFTLLAMGKWEETQEHSSVDLSSLESCQLGFLGRDGYLQIYSNDLAVVIEEKERGEAVICYKYNYKMADGTFDAATEYLSDYIIKQK